MTCADSCLLPCCHCRLLFLLLVHLFVLHRCSGVASMACFFGGSVGACTVAIYPLQVSLSLAGRLQKGCSPSLVTHTQTQTQKQADTPAPRHSLTHSVTLTWLRLLCLLRLVLHPQILLTAGGRFGVTSIVLSLLVRLLLDAVRRMRRRPAPSSSTPWWKAPPPWLAVFVGVLPAQLTRLLLRTGNWNDFANVFGLVVALSWTYCGLYLFYGVLYAVSCALYMSACLVTTLLASWVVTPLMWLQLPLGGLKRKLLTSPEDAMSLLSGLIQEQLDQDWPRLWYAIVFYAWTFLEATSRPSTETSARTRGYSTMG